MASAHQSDPAPPDARLSAEFETFYLATITRTQVIATRLACGDLHVAADATQEAYIVMWQRWPHRRGLPTAHNQRYVIGIVSNKVCDWYRRSNSAQSRWDDRDIAVEDLGHARVLDELATLAAVRDAVERQPPRRRAVGILFFLEGWTVADIADSLQLTPSTVRTHVQRLREVLKPFVDSITELGRGGEQQ